MADGHAFYPFLQNDAMVTKEEIQNLLREAIAPLEEKFDNLNNTFKNLKKAVDFLNEKCDDVLSQLRQTNEKVHLQATSFRQVQKHLDNVKKESCEATMGFENLAQYLRTDCLKISGMHPSENCTSNDIVIAVGWANDVPVKQDISTSHPLPSCNSDTPTRIIVKFTRRDTSKRVTLRHMLILSCLVDIC